MSIKPLNIKLLISILIIFASFPFFCNCSIFQSQSNEQPTVEIVSWMTRERIIHIDYISLRSTVIVAFKIKPQSIDLSNMSVAGALFRVGKLLAKDEIHNLDSSGNNLGFDIPLSDGMFSYGKPYSIPDGKYSVVVQLFDQNRKLITQTQKEFNKNQIGRTFHGFDQVYEQPKYILINEEKTDGGSLRLRLEAIDQTKTDRGWRQEAKDQQTVGGSLRSRQEAKDQNTEKGYVIFQKSYLERVYQNTEPKEDELITEISAEISRNESKPLTFSIRPSKDLGRVKISIPPLKDKQGKTSNVDVQVGAVNQLTEVVREDDKKNVVYYQYAPKIIEDKEVIVPPDHTQTNWLTIKANSDTKPADYYGSIKIIPQTGKQTQIPIHIKVLPLTLTDTDKQYGMMMDYAFYEMDNNSWTEKDRDILKKRGMEIYRDLREHGMTIVYPHSHFYYRTDKKGEPILHSLRAGLESYKNLQFPGPFIWYLGHLLQTAKTKHPGSILNYDSEVAKRRLQDLLIRFERMASDLAIPKNNLIVQLVDEPDPDQKERTRAGKELHKAAKQLGFKTLITRSWSDVDVICTGTPDNEKQAEQLRKMGEAWWIYPNNTLNSKNLAYARYVFGFGAWRWGVDGVVPWTYQMSQGSNGNPFTVLDGPEIMVDYPGINGPISTPTWEAIRDGINDYKYIYQLEKLIRAEKARGNLMALSIENQLAQLKQNIGKLPSPEENDFGDWTPEAFEKHRKQIIEWLLQLMRTT